PGFTCCPAGPCLLYSVALVWCGSGDDRPTQVIASALGFEGAMGPLDRPLVAAALGASAGLDFTHATAGGGTSGTDGLVATPSLVRYLSMAAPGGTAAS